MYSSACVRNYPIQFGLAIAKILPELKASAMGCPRAPDEKIYALDCFASRSTEDEAELCELYSNAQLSTVFEYIRGGKGLRVPEPWRPHVPHSWPEPPKKSE